MALTRNQKLFILVIVVVVILYLVYMRKEGAASVAAPEPAKSTDNNSVDTNTVDTQSVDSSMKSVIVKPDTTLQQSDAENLLLQKMTTKNTAPAGSYKKVSYAEGTRDGKAASDLDSFFELGDPLNASENSNFMPNDESGPLASYSGSPRKELSDDEKFNASALLPKEEKQDWFEDVTPQKIKNRHLINIYRPIGVNTVITSRKNGSLDLRGNPVNPKTFVSPFLNSSIEPDVNARGICT